MRARAFWLDVLSSANEAAGGSVARSEIALALKRSLLEICGILTPYIGQKS
jgi:hypothetical protein